MRIVKCGIEIFLEKIKEHLAEGYRVEIKDLLSAGLVVKGTFPSANAPWDETRNSLIPYFAVKDGKKAALSDITMTNVTEGARTLVKRVLDVISKTEGVITNQPGVMVYISGTSLLLNATASDEGGGLRTWTAMWWRPPR